MTEDPRINPDVPETDDPGRTRRSGARPEETPDYWLLEPGMKVMGSDGEVVGTIKEVRETDFHLDRPMAPDCLVPFDYCMLVRKEGVTLVIPADEVDNVGFARP